MANIEKSLVTKAVKALMYHHAQKLENKQDVKGKIKAKTPLMPELEAKSVSLIVTLNNLPQSAIRQKPYLIPLKFPLRKYGNTEICLFVKDPTKTVKKQLAEKDIKIKKVLGVDKIHKKFNTFELKRILCDSYEFFLADDRIVPIIPRLASNTFYKKKKQPHVISLEPYNTLENRIKKAVESAHLFIQKGHCCNIKVGSTDVDADQMVENICNVLEYLGDKAPLKWSDIQSIHVKTDDSIALPLYTNPDLVAEASPDATASITNKKRSRKEISESVDDSEEKEEKPKKPTTKKQKKEEPAQEAPAKNAKAAKKAAAIEKKQDEEPKKQAKDETPAPQAKKQKKTKGKKKDVEMFDDQEMNVDDEELKKSIESFSKAKKQKQQQLGAGKIKSGVVKAYPKKLKAKK